MKILFSIALAVLASASNPATQNVFQSFEVALIGGSIVMEDFVTGRATTDDNSAVITDFEIYATPGNQLIDQIDACDGDECTFDLSHLASGTYRVVAILQGGGNFGDTVVVGS